MPYAGQSLPTVEVIGPAGRLIINESNLPQYRTRGYRLMDEPAPKPAPAPAPVVAVTPEVSEPSMESPEAGRSNGSGKGKKQGT